MFVADVGYGQLNLTGSFGLERWPDIIYFSSTLLIALAGYFQAHPTAAADGTGTTLSRWLLALPYVALAAGYWVLITLAVGKVTGELIEVLYGAVVLTAVVLVRRSSCFARTADCSRTTPAWCPRSDSGPCRRMRRTPSCSSIERVS